MSAQSRMDFFEVIHSRRSIRAFRGTEVEATSLEAILSAIHRAPSAGNLQAYHVYVVREDPVKRALAAAALRQDFMAQAPVVLVFCAHSGRAAKYGRRGETLYAVQDATLAAAYAQLAATSVGLATCWIGAFDEDKLARILALPAGQRPVAMLPVGHPAESPAPTPRSPMSDLVSQYPAK